MAKEWGACIYYGWVDGDGYTAEERRANGFNRDIDESEAIKTLCEQAAKELPPSSRYEIRKMIPLNYGRSKGIGVYHGPEMEGDEAWNDAKPGLVPCGGYYLVARFTTPESVAA